MNGQLISVVGIGSINISKIGTLNHFLHVLLLSANLLSLSKLRNSITHDLLITLKGCILYDKDTWWRIGLAEEKGNIYYIGNINRTPPSVAQVAATTTHLTSKAQLKLWHHRLGHLSLEILKLLYLHRCKDLHEYKYICEACQLAKHKYSMYPPPSSRSLKPFDLIHNDTWGPAPMTTSHGRRWFITFIDDCSHMTWIWLMSHKSKVAKKVVFFSNGQTTI